MNGGRNWASGELAAKSDAAQLNYISKLSMEMWLIRHNQYDSWLHLGRLR